MQIFMFGVRRFKWKQRWCSGVLTSRCSVRGHTSLTDMCITNKTSASCTFVTHKQQKGTLTSHAAQHKTLRNFSSNIPRSYQQFQPFFPSLFAPQHNTKLIWLRPHGHHTASYVNHPEQHWTHTHAETRILFYRQNKTWLFAGCQNFSAQLRQPHIQSNFQILRTFWKAHIFLNI